VFLVSVKLILIGSKNTATEKRMELHLRQIKELLAGNGSLAAIREEKSAGNPAERIRQAV